MKAPALDQWPIGLWPQAPGAVLGVAASDGTLHYCSPAHGGWGVVRAALLVPESALLFVCPPACGRHGAIAAIEQGYKNRVAYLCITENEIVLGGYEAEIERGVAEFLTRARPRPRALMVCVSCIDDLLGTDHSAALERMEAAHGLPIRLARMNPIQLDGKLPPGQRIQQTFYQFLSPSTQRDRGVVVLGSFVPPARDSELARVLEDFGFGPLRHPSFCRGFEEFREVARSALALNLRPEGRAAEVTVAQDLGIPAHFTPVAFHPRTIAGRYRALAAFLKAQGAQGPGDPDWEAFLDRETEAAGRALGRLADRLLGLRVAVDGSATASAFDLALALVEAGVTVVRVYAEKLPAHEQPSFEALTSLAPGLLVCNPSHHRNHRGRPAEPLADLAIGFTAGFATSAPRTVPLAFDEGLYGFEAVARLVQAVERVLDSGDADLGSQVRAYGLVV